MKTKSLEDQLEIYESSPVVVYTCDPGDEFAVTHISPGITALLGWEPADFLNDPGFWACHVHPADKERAIAGFSSLLQSNHYRHAYRFQHKDGSYRWLDDVLRLERDASGDPNRIVGCWIVIGPKRQAEQAPNESEAHFRSIIENMAETFYRTDLDGRITIASPAAEELLGYTPDEAIGLELASLYVDPEGRAMFLEALAQNDGFVRDYQAALRHKNGSTVWVSTNSKYVRDGGGNIVGVEGTVRDVTAQKKAEQALLDSRDQLRQITDNLPVLIAYADAQQRYCFANKTCCQWLAQPAEEIVGKTIAEIYGPAYETFRVQIERVLNGCQQTIIEAVTFPDGVTRTTKANRVPHRDLNGDIAGFFILSEDVTELHQAEKALRKSERALSEAQKIAHIGNWSLDLKTGDIHWSDEVYRIFGRNPGEFEPTSERFFAAVYPDDVGAVRDSADQAFSKGLPHSIDHRIVLPDGTVRWVHEEAISTRDQDGELRYLVGTVQDITERKEMEQQIHRVQKLEAIGQLTGGVAHDFNNLLAVILGNTEILADQLGDNHLLVSIDRAATRGAELTQRLLAFSRRQVLQPQPIDLKELFPDLCELLQRTLGEPVKILSGVREDIWPVLADPGQLENALLNLAINARDAMPDGGVLEIWSENVHLHDHDLRITDDVAAGDYVQITVRDTGTGMANDVLDRAFEPFFSTKEVGEGSGLGLSMVYGFARQSGGAVVIESAQGKGTEVRMFLPSAVAASGSDQPIQDAEQLDHGQGQTVLVLEDDPEVRSLTTDALEKLSYRVLEASDASAAMQIFDDEAGQIDLLLSDVVLPGGASGPEFAAKVKRLNPQLKLVFMSGYTDDLYTSDKVPGFDETLLTKPFRRADLAKAIHDSLSA